MTTTVFDRTRFRDLLQAALDDDYRLSHAERDVAMAMLRHTDHDGCLTAGKHLIAQWARRSVSTVSRAIQALWRCGLAIWDGGWNPTTPEPRRLPNAYRLLVPERLLPADHCGFIIENEGYIKEVDEDSCCQDSCVAVTQEEAETNEEVQETVGRTIELTAADGFTLSAYAAGPGNDGPGNDGPGNDAPDAAPKGGVVIVQEIFGLTRHVRDMADRFAAAGYAVLAPALFDRLGRGIVLKYDQDGVNTGRDLRLTLNDQQIMMDIEAAADHLAGLKLAIVGFSFGGSVAWQAATRLKRFSAACCWYSSDIHATRNETANCPVQMHFAERDPTVPTVRIGEISVAQPKAEIFIYGGAQHGFACDGRESYSKPDTELAAKRSLEWLARHLKE